MGNAVYFYCADIYFEGKVVHRVSGVLEGFDRVVDEESYDELRRKVEEKLLNVRKPSDMILITSLNLV